MSAFSIQHSAFNIRPDIANMEPYIPIVPLEVLSARLGRKPEEITKLDANENPYGPSPKALAALANGRYFHIYPDPETNDLRGALSHFLHLPKTRLMAGAGADELIDVILRVVLNPNDVVIDCPPSFGMYPFSTHINSGQYVAVPRREDFSVDVAAVESAVSTHPTAKVLFLCSPNNPDGSLISDKDLRRLLALPVLVVLDEAYIEFAEQRMNSVSIEENLFETGLEPVDPKFILGRGHIHWALEYDNLVVLRTFSKLAGLAGLRVGYGGFPEWLLPHLWKIKQPYNVNVAAATAAIAALEDGEWLQDKVNLIVTERERLSEQLRQFPVLQVYPSQSNFVLCRVHGRSTLQLKQDLETEGVLVRYFNKPGLQNCIRVSVGRPCDTDKLIKAIEKVISNQYSVPSGQ